MIDNSFNPTAPKVKLTLKLDVKDFLDREEVGYTIHNKGFFVFKKCPFCNGSQKSSISYKNEKYGTGHFMCLGKCGKKSFAEVFAQIKGISVEEAKKAVYSYNKLEEDTYYDTQIFSKETTDHILRKMNESKDSQGEQFEYLNNIVELEFYPFEKLSKEDKRHQKYIDYLKKRGFSDRDIELSEASVLSSDRTGLIKEILTKTQLDEDEIQTLFGYLKSYAEIFNQDKTKNKYSFAIEKEFREKIEKTFPKRKAIIWSKILYNFQNRVVFPIKILGKIVGYVGRDITGESKLKVLNSTDFSSRTFLWNYDNVKNAEYHIISEGIFSANSNGIDNAVAILGNKITSEGKVLDKFNLLGMLKAKKVYIYLDVGTRKEIFELGDKLGSLYEEVYVVISPTIYKTKVDIPISTIIKCEIFAEKIKEKHYYMSYEDYLIAKRALRYSRLKYEEKNNEYKKIKNDFDSNSFRKVISLAKKIIHDKNIETTIERLCDGSFLDSNDFSRETNQRLIKEARPFDETDAVISRIDKKIIRTKEVI